MTMDARKFRILQAIIDDYILTAIPVGSRTISKKYEMGLSSATIRNEMSDLEELGYLDQPHVSAGRIPSAKAYRLYVDQLLKNGSIRTGDAADVRAYFTNRAQQMEDVISRAAQVLSGLTHYTSLVMSPKGAELRIRTLQLVPVSSQSALLVVVTDGGIMRDSIIRVGNDLDADALYAVSRTLTERLSGHTLSEALSLIRETERDMRAERQVLSGVAEFLDAVEGEGGAIEQYNAWQSAELGRSINPDMLRAYLIQAGAQWAEVTQPVQTSIQPHQYARVGAIDVTHEVIQA